MRKSTKSSTASEIFVDTSGFYALLVQGDNMHARGVDLLARAAELKRRFVTSDYVLDETATLLRARGYGRLIAPYFESVFASQSLRVEWMDPERFDDARRYFLKHQDQDWSFTDCFSFCLMRSLYISDALTKDKNFRQAGLNPLLI
jgi:uncharacterized protein